ncbi:MAG: GGDEF domain-containing protein [Gemmatimonadota bacterium]
MAWLYWGADRTQSFSLRRKILYVNTVALLAILFMLGFDIAYLVSGNAALIRSTAIHLPAFVIAGGTPWLNRRGEYTIARWAIALTLTGMVGATVALVSGSFLGLHYIFIVIAMIAIAIFPLRDWRSTAFLVVLNIGAFAWSAYVGVDPEASLFVLPRQTIAAFKAGYLGTMIFTVLFVAWLGEFATHQNEHELESLSGIDPLTQLPNRRRIMQRLAERLLASRRLGEYGGVLFLDVDNLKTINDVHGHECGDFVLQEVAQRLLASIRAMEMAARLGGDEFVVVLSHLGRNRDEALVNLRSVSQNLSAVLSQPYHLGTTGSADDGVLEIDVCSCSIGGTLFDGADLNPDAILQRADSAMYSAKAAGKNRVEIVEAYANQLSS